MSFLKPVQLCAKYMCALVSRVRVHSSHQILNGVCDNSKGSINTFDSHGLGRSYISRVSPTAPLCSLSAKLFPLVARGGRKLYIYYVGLETNFILTSKILCTYISQSSFCYFFFFLQIAGLNNSSLCQFKILELTWILLSVIFHILNIHEIVDCFFERSFYVSFFLIPLPVQTLLTRLFQQHFFFPESSPSWTFHHIDSKIL